MKIVTKVLTTMLVVCFFNTLLLTSCQKTADKSEYATKFNERKVSSLKLPSIFSDGMVLQRNQKVNIFGVAKNGTTVEVTFNGKTYKEKADENNGSFIISLPKMKSGTGYTMTVTNEGDTITYNDVAIGEVFLCGGQSNMQITMGDTEWYGDFFTSQFDDYEDNSEIRQFLVDLDFSQLAKNDVRSSGWKKAEKANFANFAPLAYLFSVNVYKNLQIPVGLVMCSAGGSAIQQWIPVDKQEGMNAEDSVLTRNQQGELYGAMMAPIITYTCGAFLWYQGESNATHYKDYDIHDEFLHVLVDNVRDEMYSPKLPVYIIELAGYNDDRIVMLRNAQAKAVSEMDNAYFITNADLGIIDNIHPTQKKELADRLALCYLATSQGMKLDYKAPTYKSHKIDGEYVTVTFDNVYDGLKTKSDTVLGFLVCGEDGIYYPATGEIISKDSVKVSSPDVSNPKNVRFYYKGYMESDLYNSSDISPTPFRTDDVELKIRSRTLMN